MKNLKGIKQGRQETKTKKEKPWNNRKSRSNTILWLPLTNSCRKTISTTETQLDYTYNYYRCCVVCGGRSNTKGSNKCDWIQCVSCSKWIHEYSSAENLLCAKCQMYLQTATSTEWTHPSNIMVFLLIISYAVYSYLKVCELLFKNLRCIHKKKPIVASFTILCGIFPQQLGKHASCRKSNRQKCLLNAVILKKKL